MIDSKAWAGGPYPVTQKFGNTGYRPDWYTYSAEYGFPPGVHIATDIGVPRGTPIYALNYGEVIQSGFSNSFRPYPVWVRTQDNPSTPEDETGYVEIYGHLQQSVVQTGQQVKPGTLLGYSGEQTVLGTTTPDGSGEHLHFELRMPDASLQSGYRAIDPENWLQGKGGPHDDSGASSR